MLSKAALALLSLLYPFLWYYGRAQGWFPYLAALMAFLWLARGIMHRQRAQKIISFLLAAFFCFSLTASLPQAMYWYPVLVNLLMLTTFACSLRQPPSAIERLARLQTPDLPAVAIRYTYRLTQIWCLFFIVNGSIAALLALLRHYQAWALYTGLISYLLMGILLGGEWLYRRKAIT